MAPKPRCPICGSKKWHKESSSGTITCSEGHVLQNYRNETNETTEFGPHAMRKRDLKSTRVKKEKKSKANPVFYHGERAMFHYFQCLQVLLRLQAKKLIELWKLPQEFEIVCRDTWALHLSLQPSPPLAEPFLHSQEQSGLQQPDITHNETGPPARERKEPEDDDNNGTDNEESRSSSSSEGENDNEIEDDPEMAELLRLASETESSGDGGGDAARPSQVKGKSRSSKNRWRRDDSPAGNIAVLVLACWTMRIPIIYKDFVDLIETYTLPYLEPVRLLPSSLTRHLTKHTKLALSPHFAPTPILLHTITSRLAKSAFLTFGIFTPELNVAPVLWRAVRHMGGNPTLYVMAKALARYLELPLALNATMAPPALQQSKSDPRSHKSDNVPPEMALVATAVVALKLVYGLDGKEVRPTEGWDPACTMPALEAYLAQLRSMNASESESSRSTFIPSIAMPTVRDYDGHMLDSYLDFCERALLPTSGKEGREISAGPVEEFFPLQKRMEVGPAGAVPDGSNRDADAGGDADANGDSRDVLPAVALAGGEESNANPGSDSVQPGALYAVHSAHDTLGVLPEEYSEVLARAACWTGASVDEVSGVVERFERRLVRLWGKSRRRESREREDDDEEEDL